MYIFRQRADFMIWMEMHFCVIIFT